MATVTTLKRAAGGQNGASSSPYLVAVDIDFAAAATAKGSALAAADIIEAISVDGPTLVLGAGIVATTADTGGSSDVALDLGVTGADPDFWVDGFDWDAAAAGDVALPATASGVRLLGADDTIDLLIQAATTVPTAGTVTVWALMVQYDVTQAKRVATEVVRDRLA